MAQTKAGSLAEAGVNVVIGFALNWSVNMAVLPLLWDANCPGLSAFRIGLVFTAVSLVRQYVLRRWFNGRTP